MIYWYVMCDIWCTVYSICVYDILMWCIMYKNYINMYDCSKVREWRADKIETEDKGKMYIEWLSE